MALSASSLGNGADIGRTKKQPFPTFDLLKEIDDANDANDASNSNVLEALEDPIQVDDEITDCEPLHPPLGEEIGNDDDDARKMLKCEWVGCTSKGKLFSDEGQRFWYHELMGHVKEHLSDIRGQMIELLLADESLIEGQTKKKILFRCSWEGCVFATCKKVSAVGDSSPIDLQFEHLTRHVFYHVFHSQLKMVDYKKATDACQRSDRIRNILPGLEKRLICEWANCNTVFDNPITFYAHVSNHTEHLVHWTFERRCHWKGCSFTARSLSDYPQHVRQHTGEMRNACHHCGVAYANASGLKRHRQAFTTISVPLKSHLNGKIVPFNGSGFTINMPEGQIL